MLYIQLSDIERLTGNMQNALYYNTKSEQSIMNCKGDTFNLLIHVTYHTRANLYFEMGQTDSAYTYATASINSSKLYSPLNHEINLSRNLNIIGYYHYEKGNYTEAEKIYTQAIQMNNKFDYCENTMVYIKLADIYIKQEKWNKAVLMGENALSIADSCDKPQYQLTALTKLVQVHEHINGYEKMAGYLQRKLNLIEQEDFTAQKKQLQKLETKFKTQLKEEENKSLKMINEEQEKKNKFQTVVLILSISILAVVLFFAVIFFWQKNRISKQKKDVERLNLLNQKIFSVISHDFKGPMLGIETLLGMHEKYGLSADTFEHQSKQLKNDLKQANLIMENLLNWAKTELGFSDLQKKEAIVRDISEEVIFQLQSLADQKELKLVNELPAKTQVPVPPDILKIILRNLLSNAIKYSYPGGSIILAYIPDKQLYLIQDEGIGMDEERLQKLFKQKVESRLGTSREIGYGIGLNIVHELILKYNGRIWIESTFNKGTRIYFTFV